MLRDNSRDNKRDASSGGLSWYWEEPFLPVLAKQTPPLFTFLLLPLICGFLGGKPRGHHRLNARSPYEKEDRAAEYLTAL